jgi:hypothetical protein
MTDKKYSFLILFIQQPSKRFSLLSTKVSDTVKREFGAQNFVKINSTSFKSDFEKNDVAGKIRDGVIMEFVRRVDMYTKEMQKSESNRNLPGWQFCHFFLIKEGLAFTFEQFKLYVNAHGIYQQLMAFLSNTPGMRSLLYLLFKY